MDNVIKHFETIDGSFRKMKLLTVGALSLAAVVSVASMAIGFSAVSRSGDRIYVLDKGVATSATVADGAAERDLEVRDHVVRFHELFFVLAPSSEAIRKNIDRALLMSDRSVYNIYNDYDEKGFYARLVSANISQQFVVDSVRLNMEVYPYRAVTYGRRYLIRESNMTAYDFVGQCQLTDVPRSESNPHGLMIEQYTVVKNEQVETRKRF